MRTKVFLGQFVLLLIFLLATFSCKKEKADPLTRLTMSLDTIFVLGEERQISVTWDPGSGVDPDLSWESSDPGVLTITGSGFAKGVGTGKTLATVRVHDGTGLQSSRTVLVQEQPEVSIGSVTDITFYSASVALNYNLGGGDLSNSSITFFWSTSSVLDTVNCQGKLRVNEEKQAYSLDLFDQDTKYYVWVYIKNRVGSEFSDSIIIETSPVPDDILGNYMLNIPLAKGTVAKYKDWIYYSNYNDNKRLYKIRTDLTEKQRITEVSSGSFQRFIDTIKSLNIIGSDIYFSGVYDTHGRLMKMKTDGTNLRVFEDKNGFPITSLYTALVIGKYIYPEFSALYYRVSSDFDEFLVHPFLNFNNNVFNNKLYFCAQEIGHVNGLFTLNVSNTDFTDVQELFRGYNLYKQSSFLGVYENSAYLLNRDTLKKIDLEFPELIQILPIKPAYFNIANYSIFYSNIEDNNKLYKCDLRGDSPVKLSDDQVSLISVIDDWLYYYGYSDNNLYRIKQDGTNRQVIE